MITLNDSTISIQFKVLELITTTGLHYVCSYKHNDRKSEIPYGEYGISTSTYNPFSLATGVTGKEVLIDFISIHNTDIITHNVIVSIVKSTTEIYLYKVQLLAGEKLEYNESTGFIKK